MWKYIAIAAIALIVGAVASPVILTYIAISFDKSRRELMEAWSSGKGLDRIFALHRSWWPRILERRGRVQWPRQGNG